MSEHATLVTDSGVTTVDEAFITEQFREAIRDSDRRLMEMTWATGLFAIGEQATGQAMRCALTDALAADDYPLGLRPALVNLLATVQ